jgi:hypothetical protein
VIDWRQVDWQLAHARPADEAEASSWRERAPGTVHSLDEAMVRVMRYRSLYQDPGEARGGVVVVPL